MVARACELTCYHVRFVIVMMMMVLLLAVRNVGRVSHLFLVNASHVRLLFLRRIAPNVPGRRAHHVRMDIIYLVQVHVLHVLRAVGHVNLLRIVALHASPVII